MKTVKVPKVCRSDMPRVWEENGDIVEYDIVDDEATMTDLLIEKMREELEEYNSDRNLEELADMFEVLRGLIYHSGHTFDEVYDAAALKRRARGDFKTGVYLTKFEWGPGKLAN